MQWARPPDFRGSSAIARFYAGVTLALMIGERGIRRATTEGSR